MRNRLPLQRFWPFALLAAIVASTATWDWIPGAAILVLWAGWAFLPNDEGPPVLQLAFTSQWFQVTAGPLYLDITGRRIPELNRCDYPPMVAVGLVSLLTLLFGILLGARLVGQRAPREEDKLPSLSWRTIIIAYALSLSLPGIAAVARFEVPGLANGIFALANARYVLLFMIFRRLLKAPANPLAMALLLTFEVVLGFTGYFAGFREALILASLAMLEILDLRRIAHWAGAIVLVITLFGTAILWTGIKAEYRRSFRDDAFAEDSGRHLSRVQTLSSDWFSRGGDRIGHDADKMISRLWQVQYPAMALHRVPAVLSHTNGAIMWRALLHVAMPRAFFSEKKELGSDSDMVRKYAGVWVAGRRQNTSIAFGYAIESYIDFGIPLMFIPIFLLGVMAGAAYRAFLKLLHDREIAVALITPLFWMTLYLFERSWIMLLGTTITTYIFLGGATVVLDRLLLVRHRKIIRPKLG
jgi:hypothetical protein